MNCGTGKDYPSYTYYDGISNSATHKISDTKETVKLSWIPPPNFEGAVTIKYSVVKQ